jgi:ribosomal-protein-serine acetyltransferase
MAPGSERRLKHAPEPKAHTSIVSRVELDRERALRQLDESDAGELYALIDANRLHLARWMPFVGQTRAVADSLAFIRTARRQLEEHRGTQFGVLVGENLVGVAGFHRIDWASRSTSIGYWLAEDAQGAGTMTLATATLVDQAFDTWELDRVEIRAGVENVRSRAIPARLGFREEGVLPAAERIGERVIDHVVYSISAGEWRYRPGRQVDQLRA